MTSARPSAQPAPPQRLLSDLPERQRIAVGEDVVSFRAAGEGPALLFLHGLLGSADSWAWQFRALTDRFKVIAWDAPGYMGSSAAAPQIEAFADRLQGFIEALDLGQARPMVIGNSMGGTLAAYLASRPDAPLSGLVQSCSHAGYNAPAGTPPTQKLIERIESLKRDGQQAYGQSRAEAMLAQPADRRTVDLAARIAAQTDADGLFAATRMLQFVDLRPRYAQIKCPMMVIFGERDPVVRPDLTEELRGLTRFATQITLSDTGHAPYLERPEAFNEAITTFADHVAATARAQNT